MSCIYDEILSGKTENIKAEWVCFKWVASCSHFARDCRNPLKCTKCESNDHVTAFHPSNFSRQPGRREEPQRNNQAEHLRGNSEEPMQQHGEEAKTEVTNSCTEVCDNQNCANGKSCAKICLTNVYEASMPNKKIRVYVVIDDQSNYSLARSELFDRLGVNSIVTDYTLETCSGIKYTKGRRAQGLVIESIDERVKYSLPSITECNEIPNNRDEIPTPNDARVYPHLKRIAHDIPQLDDNADILLLIGRDVPPLHKVQESINGATHAPWGQRWY